MSKIISKTFHADEQEIDSVVNKYFSSKKTQDIHVKILWVNTLSYANRVMKSFMLEVESDEEMMRRAANV